MRTDVQRPFETTWEDWVLGGGIRRAFADPARPLEVEIGPGDDDFLLESALGCPEHNWLGIEYSRKRVGRYARKVRDRAGEIGNLRLAWRPAADVTPFLADVLRFHVYFPDPWPKKHHHRYRLLTPEFLRGLGRALVAGGEILIATDHLAYVEDMLGAFAEVPAFRSLLPDPGYVLVEADERTTVFERRWRAEGRFIHRLGFVWEG